MGNADLVDGDENSIYAGAYDAVYGDGNDLTYTASDIIHGNKNAVHHNSPTKGGTSARIQVFGAPAASCRRLRRRRADVNALISQVLTTSLAPPPRRATSPATS